MKSNKRKFANNENDPRKKQKTDNNDIIDRELWIKSGDLNDMYKNEKDVVRRWRDLANDIVTLCQKRPEKNREDLYIMDPLEITLSSINSEIEGGETINKTHKFIKDFMSKNGQLEYIANSEWFKNEKWKIVVDINFYPNRDFQKDSNKLAAHKDRYCKNLFVNLIFDNTTRILGTEWTLDDLERDHEWNAILNDVLPEELVSQLEKARESMKTIQDNKHGKGYWESSILEPFGYVSFINELIWHSTPAALPRESFNKDMVTNLLNYFIAPNYKYDKKDRQSFIKLYEAFLIISEFGHIDHKDLKTINSFYDFLQSGSDKSINKKLLDAIDKTDWTEQKITGRLGQYRTNEQTTKSCVIGKNRRRKNSTLEARNENQNVLKEMKKPGTNELHKRSFIRTWVTLKKV